MEKMLSIIIVSWNVCKDVIQCIDSIAKNRPSFPYEIILVDNASSDGTVYQVQENFPDIITIENSGNVGFSAANNKGIQRASGEYLLFLNPDTLALPESFDKLIDYMKAHPEVGMCGPQILNPDMTIQRSVRRFPNFRGMFYRFTLFKYFALFRQHARDWKMDDFNHQSQAEAEQLIGAALIAKTSLINELGGFDERFFMYYEEVDLCLRIKQAGLGVMFYPDAKIIHLGGQSARQIPAKVKFMTLCSLVLFMKKHHPTCTGHFLILIFKVGVWLRQFFDMIIFLLASLFSVMRPEKFKKNYLRVKSCFLFLVKYYINFLFT